MFVDLFDVALRVQQPVALPHKDRSRLLVRQLLTSTFAVYAAAT